MGKNTQGLRDFQEKARLDAFEAFRAEVDPGRLGLALQAIRQRIDQDLMIAVAAYEIDCALTDANDRIQRNPKDALPEILKIKARLDVVDELMQKYEDEYLELHPEIAETLTEGYEPPVEEGEDVVVLDPEAAGWDTVEAGEEVAPVETDPASSDE